MISAQLTHVQEGLSCWEEGIAGGGGGGGVGAATLSDLSLIFCTVSTQGYGEEERD